ncbi:MAG TPA: GNAT family N-acetyltransferase [Ktedonobacterales bacterium]
MQDTIAHDLSPDALAAAIEENEIQYWLYRAHVAGWEVHENAALTWYYSGLDDAERNGVLRTDLPAGDADIHITKMLAWFDSRSVPMSWWGGPSRRPADLGVRLVAHGLISEGEDPGMAVDLHALNEDLPLPAGFAVERVRDGEAVRRWLRVLRIAHSRDPDVSQVPLALYGPAAFDDADPLRLYIASVNGAPVATALVLLAAGVAGVYYVATIPAARRQGIGAGVTLAALRDARAAGYHIGVLGASQMGVGVYQRLGFREYCKLTLYVREP